MQTEVARLSQEVSTGRMADVGLNLGAETSRAATLHFDSDALGGLIDSNGQLSQRLVRSQSALGQLTSGANDFLNQVIATRDSNSPIGALASSALSGFIADANASDGKDYLFSGINTAIKPLADFTSGPKAAIDAAFVAKFGVAPGDPAASTIDGASMSSFLDNEFAQLFNSSNWASTWSSAADQPTRNSISMHESVDTSVSANQPAIRNLAMAYSMVAALGTDTFGADARKAVLDHAAGLLGEANTGIVALQANLGTVQKQVSDATTQLSAQRDIIATRIGTLEGVDAAEAKTRIDTFATQIEMSYSLTAKLLQMSILNYA